MITDGRIESVTPEKAQAVVAQVKEYCRRTGRKHAAVAREIGCSPTTISSVFSFTYKGNWQAIILGLDQWLEDELKREDAPKPSEFVETSVAEEIMMVADVTVQLRCIGLVYDRHGSGIGKTMALRAIHAEKPGSAFISVQTAGSGTLGLLQQIGRALRVNVNRWGSRSHWMHAIVECLTGTTRLLLIDEIHKLCNGRDDAGLHVLRDIYDATDGAPQLWCGTTDLVGYLERRTIGREPLAQIRRRIGIARDLRERTTGTGGGQPLFTIEEIRKVFGRSKMRLAPDAARYLSMLASLPDCGGLGACRNLVVMSIKINQDKDTLTADMLRAAHRLLVNRHAYETLEQQMEQFARPLAKVG